MNGPAARFDDLRPSHPHGFALGPVDETLVADRVDQVEAVLQAAAERVRRGMWVAGYLAYEAAPALDPRLQVPGPGSSPFGELPPAWFAVSASRVPRGDLPTGAHTAGPWRPTVDAGTYRGQVAEIRRLIASGQTYQVNHTFRLDASFAGSVESLYRDLIHAQRGGYGALLDAGRWAIASASPELFVEWLPDRLTMRPMKGTGPRGVDPESDDDRRLALARSEKDRAENLMIVDMARNDLGRICQVGSIDVPELFVTEKYETVWQMTSTVTGRPRPGVGLVEVLQALFPSASITGAPKVAAMDVIASFEDEPRGVYCGAIGYGGPGRDGPEWAFSVAIRTVVVDRDRGVARYGTGGGITWDSSPDGELGEAMLKAAVLSARTSDFALLESMRWDPGAGVAGWDRHLRRLERSAHHFDVPLDLARLTAALDSAVAGQTRPRRLRLTVERDGRCRAMTEDLPEPPPRPVRLAVDTVAVDRLDPLLYHKTTAREVYEAAARRHPDADDVVLVNEAGEATETTIANLLVLTAGRWLTPPVSSGCLAGTARQALLEAGAVEEGRITVAELLAAEAVERVNAVRGRERCTLVQ